MPLCGFYTGKFTQCTHNTPRADHTYCGQHADKAHRMIERVGPVPEGGCPCVVGNPGHWCGRPLQEGQPICEHHVRRRDGQAQHALDRERIRTAMMQLTAEYLLQNPRLEWTAVVDELKVRMNMPEGAPWQVERLVAYAAARRFFILTTPETLPVAVFMHYWVGVPFEEQLPAVMAVPMGQMGALAVDTQNVHREVVVKQTNTNVDILLEAAKGVPAGLDPEGWATVQWIQTGVVFQDYVRVIMDVHHWFTKRTCKATGDYLYKQVFTGVIAKLVKIDNAEVRGELVKRLWEECVESLDMCCEGHISRLANVFVGFDEAFKSPMSPNEMLQAQIAEIAGMKLRLETKLAKANALMDELKIPVEDRLPWLQALAE
jgi:hypothetical protein